MAKLELEFGTSRRHRLPRIPNGHRDDIEMRCLTLRRRRARGLLPIGKRLLYTLAGSADSLGWLGSSSDGDRSGY
jgi:hypothetical protein